MADDSASSRATERRERSRRRRAEQRPSRKRRPRPPDESEGQAPPQRKRRTKRPRPLEPASKAARFANLVIDTIAYSLIYMQLVFVWALVAPSEGMILVSESEVVGGPSDFTFHFVYWLVVFGYYIFAETVLGRTLGKFVTGTKVVTLDGQPPSLKTVLLRTLIRAVPFDPLSFVADGWHDTWSRTRVVKVERRSTTAAD